MSVTLFGVVLHVLLNGRFVFFLIYSKRARFSAMVWYPTEVESKKEKAESCEKEKQEKK